MWHLKMFLFFHIYIYQMVRAKFNSSGCPTCQNTSLEKSRWSVNGRRQRSLTLSFACVFLRSTPSTSSSVRAGETRGWSLMDPCRFYPWTTSWPARSGLLTPFSTTGRSLSPTTWPPRTNCCAWSTTAHSCTQWGEAVLTFLSPFSPPESHMVTFSHGPPPQNHVILSLWSCLSGWVWRGQRSGAAVSTGATEEPEFSFILAWLKTLNSTSVLAWGSCLVGIPTC